MLTKVFSKNLGELKSFIAGLQVVESVNRINGGGGYGWGPRQPQPPIGNNYPIQHEVFDGAGVEVGEQWSVTLVTGAPPMQQIQPGTQLPVSVCELKDGFLFTVEPK